MGEYEYWQVAAVGDAWQLITVNGVGVTDGEVAQREASGTLIGKRLKGVTNECVLPVFAYGTHVGWIPYVDGVTIPGETI